MNKMPAFQFYTGDWMKDPALRACSPAARGLWMDCLCLMHDSPRRGYLEHANGKPVTPSQLARMTGCTASEVKRYTLELESVEVFSRDASGVIYSRRMARDEEKRKQLQTNGQAGGRPKVNQEENLTESKDQTKPEQDTKPEPNQDPNQNHNQTGNQKGWSSSSSSSSASAKEESVSSKLSNGPSPGVGEQDDFARRKPEPEPKPEPKPNPGKAKKALAKKPRAEPTGPHADARRDFCARWKAKYHAEDDYGFDFGKHGAMLSWMLEKVGGNTQRLSVIFRRFFDDDDPFYAADAKHSLDKLRQNFARWQVESLPLPRAGSLGKAQDRDAYAVNLGKRMLEEQQRLGLLEQTPAPELQREFT